MFIYIATELNQLYNLYDIDMINWQLLVNLAKPMCFMSEVDYFWRQVSPENVRGQLNKKIAKLDEIGIGSGHDYKAWLICLFTVFTKKCLWQGNWVKLYSTTDVKNYEELWKWFPIIRTNIHFESDCIHMNETWQLGPCIQFA